MTEVLSLMTLATAAMVFVALAFFSHRSQSFGYVAILATFLADMVFPNVSLGVVAGFNLTPPDLIAGPLLAAGLIRLAFRRMTSLHVTWGVFTLSALLSFYAGFRLLGPKTPGVEFRPSFFFIVVLLYCSSFDVTAKSLSRLQRAWYLTCAGLVILAIYRWLAIPFNLPVMDTWSATSMAGPGETPRTLPAAATLFLLQGWLLTGPSIRGQRLSRAAKAGSYVLLGLVVILQHRTVWIAAAACLVFLFVRLKTILHRPVWLAGAAAVMVLVLAFINLDTSNPIAASIRESVSEPAHARSTFEWRVSGWQQLLLNDNSPKTVSDLVFGSHPFGVGLIRKVDGYKVNYSAHNYYVDTFLRTGIVGLAALLVGYALLVWRIRRVRSGEPATLSHWRIILTSILVSQLVYFFGYGASYEQGVLLGISLSLATSRWPAVAGAGNRVVLAGSRGMGRAWPRALWRPAMREGL